MMAKTKTRKMGRMSATSTSVWPHSTDLIEHLRERLLIRPLEMYCGQNFPFITPPVTWRSQRFRPLATALHGAACADRDSLESFRETSNRQFKRVEHQDFDKLPVSRD